VIHFRDLLEKIFIKFAHNQQGFLMNFRFDINALRAVAVTAVVIYHFNNDWLPAGFAGVDVFFVISGFLMTSIIMTGLEKEKFSIIGFYKARVIRIIPALAFLCFVLLVFGWFFLNPLDYKELGKDVAASVSFTSNIVYWTEANYFSPSSTENWLLHTWSLSVEWQFYLLYPVVVFLLNRYLSLQFFKIIFVSSTLLLLGFSIFVLYKSPSAAYFMLPTRAWQMLAGGLIFLFPIKLRDSNGFLLQITGLLLIFLSFIIYSKITPWPGYASILPIVGTYFFLIADHNSSRLVDNLFTNYIGKWSYSIYLWHWPVVVFGNYFVRHEYWLIIGIPLSIILGAFSYYMVETKNLNSYVGKLAVPILHPITFAVLIAATSLGIFVNSGFIQRMPSNSHQLIKSAQQAQGDWGYPSSNMIIGGSQIRFIEGTTDKNILVMGSSHMEQIYPYVKSLGSEYNVYFLTMGGCFVTPIMSNPKWSCSNIQDYSELIEKVKFERILTSFYSFPKYLPVSGQARQSELNTRIAQYDEFLLNIKNKIPVVYLTLGEPTGWEFSPKHAIRHNLKDHISTAQARKKFEIHYAAFAELKELNNVVVIDPIDYLCKSGKCMTRDEEMDFFYRDETHMRPQYAIENLRFLDVVFR
jgi:peptidoglycan/LPS O-acetylase OafA/YrhL